MRTLLALVVAAAMIAGALYVRGGTDGNLPGPLTSREPAQLVCVSELKSVCEAIAGDHDNVEVRVEEAGATADALLADEPVEDDAWLTLAPWPQLVSEARVRGGGAALPPPGTPLARSPLVRVVAKERGAVLEKDCADLSWRCVGRSAGRDWTDLGGEETWGRFKPGFTDPSASASGLLVLGQAASEFLGTTEFSARDLDREGFLSWFQQLGDGVPGHGTPGNTPFQQQLRFGAAQFDLVGTTEAEAAAALASPRGEDFTMRYPKNLAVADVVLAPLRDGDGADRLASLFEESGKTALAEAGWRVEGQPAAAGVPAEPALPAKSNVPTGGVLDALSGRWEENAR